MKKMSETEQIIWKAMLANREATLDELAEITGCPKYEVSEVMRKSGTPEEIRRKEPELVPGRVAVLREAETLTAGDRNRDYGDPVSNMEHIAHIFNAITGHGISGRDVAVLMNCVKIARRYTNPTHYDSYVDGAAYTGIEWECAMEGDK